jgi:methyl-accepting chemotaxis protein
MLLVNGAFAAEVCTKKAAEAKVEEVCKAISEKGDAVKSDWPAGLLFSNCGDNYVWVQDTSAEIKMVMHPIKQRLNGQEIGKQLDENKFMLFTEFDKAAKANAKGAWVDYVWAKPGQEKATPKTSFVKICKMKSGTSWIAGSGVWKEDLK